MTESKQFFGWAMHELNKVLWAALATDKPKVWEAAEEIKRIIIKALREYESPTKH